MITETGPIILEQLLNEAPEESIALRILQEESIGPYPFEPKKKEGSPEQQERKEIRYHIKENTIIQPYMGRTQISPRAAELYSSDDPKAPNAAIIDIDGNGKYQMWTYTTPDTPTHYQLVKIEKPEFRETRRPNAFG